jgi:hypothetical protein
VERDVDWRALAGSNMPFERLPSPLAGLFIQAAAPIAVGEIV